MNKTTKVVQINNRISFFRSVYSFISLCQTICAFIFNERDGEPGQSA